MSIKVGDFFINIRKMPIYRLFGRTTPVNVIKVHKSEHKTRVSSELFSEVIYTNLIKIFTSDHSHILDFIS